MAIEACRPEFIRTVLAKVGEPFSYHYAQPNPCNYGDLVIDTCMETGLGGPEGYDCTGLIIASLSEVHGFDHEWARRFRHPQQLEELGLVTVTPAPGDILTGWWRYDSDDPNVVSRTYHHSGVLTRKNRMCHATGERGVVVNRKVPGYFEEIYTVPLGTLVEVAYDHYRP